MKHSSRQERDPSSLSLHPLIGWVGSVNILWNISQQTDASFYNSVLLLGGLSNIKSAVCKMCLYL